MIFCLIKQVYTIKNRMFLLIWARLEPPTEVQIFLNCPIGVTPLVLCIGRRISSKIDLIDGLLSIFLIFSL